MQFLEWYFHKFGANYKAGTYKGLDITFGKEDVPMYGGILLRTIQDASDFNFYEGSCSLVTQIFKFFEAKEVKDFISSNPHFSKSNIYKVSDLDSIKALKDDDKANALMLVELTGDKTGISFLIKLFRLLAKQKDLLLSKSWAYPQKNCRRKRKILNEEL